MITRDEEANLERCLASARPVVDEIILVDTGSRDRTVHIAQDYGAKVSHFQWCDDFAAARNASLNEATGHWILQLDADEELTPEAASSIRPLVSSLPTDCWGLFIPCRSHVLKNGSHTHTVFHRLLLFRNHPDLRYRGRIHEQIEFVGQGPQPEFRCDDAMTVDHHGYMPDQMEAKEKKQRNLHLLQLAVAENPEDPYYRYHLGKHFHTMERFAEAVGPLRRAIELTRNPHAGYLPNCFTMLVVALVRTGRVGEVPALVAEAERSVPKLTAPFYCAVGNAYGDLGWLEQALSCFQRAIDAGHVSTSTESDPRAHTWLPRLGMGMVFEALGQWERAQTCYQEALAFVPQHVDLNSRLATVLAKQGRMEEAYVFSIAARESAPAESANTLRHVRICLATGRDVEARDLLSGVSADALVSDELVEDFVQASLQAGELQLAYDTLCTLVSRRPDQLNRRLQLCDLLTGAGECKEALRVMEEGWQFCHTDPRYQQRLSTVLLALGHLHEAADALEVAAFLMERDTVGHISGN